jgi:hypothetical protein
MPNAAPNAFCKRKMDMMKLFILSGATRKCQTWSIEWYSISPFVYAYSRPVTEAKISDSAISR